MLDLAQETKISGTCTLYVNNINEKIAVNKVKYVLAKLFGRYGTVLGITAHRNLKMKGQAFVTYKDAKSCEKAVVKLQGRPVFKKKINVTYSSMPSDFERENSGDSEGISQRKAAKKAKIEADLSSQNKEVQEGKLLASAQLSKAQIKQWKLLPPHKVLLLQNIEESQLESTHLKEKFGAFIGFQNVRLIKFRKLAFVDFELEMLATACLEKIDHNQFGPLSLFSYAKK